MSNPSSLFNFYSHASQIPQNNQPFSGSESAVIEEQVRTRLFINNSNQSVQGLRPTESSVQAQYANPQNLQDRRIAPATPSGHQLVKNLSHEPVTPPHDNQYTSVGAGMSVSDESYSDSDWPGLIPYHVDVAQRTQHFRPDTITPMVANTQFQHNPGPSLQAICSSTKNQYSLVQPVHQQNYGHCQHRDVLANPDIYSRGEDNQSGSPQSIVSQHNYQCQRMAHLTDHLPPPSFNQASSWQYHQFVPQVSHFDPRSNVLMPGASTTQAVNPESALDLSQVAPAAVDHQSPAIDPMLDRQLDSASDDIFRSVLPVLKQKLIAKFSNSCEDIIPDVMPILKNQIVQEAVQQRTQRGIPETQNHPTTSLSEADKFSMLKKVRAGQAGAVKKTVLKSRGPQVRFQTAKQSKPASAGTYQAHKRQTNSGDTALVSQPTSHGATLNTQLFSSSLTSYRNLDDGHLPSKKTSRHHTDKTFVSSNSEDEADERTNRDLDSYFQWLAPEFRRTSPEIMTLLEKSKDFLGVISLDLPYITSAHAMIIASEIIEHDNVYMSTLHNLCIAYLRADTNHHTLNNMDYHEFKAIYIQANEWYKTPYQDQMEAEYTELERVVNNYLKNTHNTKLRENASCKTVLIQADRILQEKIKLPTAVPVPEESDRNYLVEFLQNCLKLEEQGYFKSSSSKSLKVK